MAITRGVGPLYVSVAAVTSNSGTLNGTTAHRSLVLVAFWRDPAGAITPTITISGESNPTPIAGSKFTNIAGVNNGSGQIFYLADIQTGGNKTITLTFGATNDATLAVMEYAGLDLASQPDNSANATGADPATMSLTTNTANALIVAGIVNNGGQSTAGSGYTLFGGGMPDDVAYQESEDQLDMSSPASKTVAFGSYAGSAWAMTAASFKAAGGGAANWGRLLGMETNRLVRVVG